MTVLLIIASLIILILAGVAAYYLLEVRKLNQKREQQQREAQARLDKARKENINSVRILSRALKQNEVSYTEASIRINGLAQMLQLDEAKMEKLSVFGQLAQATSHIPILDAWKKLSKQEKRRLEKERLSIEEKYKDFVDAAVNEILETPNFFD